MTKQRIVNYTTLGIQLLSALLGLSAYLSVIPEGYQKLALLIFGLATAGKEALIACNVYLVGPSAVQSPAVQDKLAALPAAAVNPTPQQHI